MAKVKKKAGKIIRWIERHPWVLKLARKLLASKVKELR